MSDLIEQLRKNLHYNPQTGVLSWTVKRRPQTVIGEPIGYPAGKGHLRFTFEGKGLYVARVAWALVYGEFPKGQIDHD